MKVERILKGKKIWYEVRDSISAVVVKKKWIEMIVFLGREVKVDKIEVVDQRGKKGE